MPKPYDMPGKSPHKESGHDAFKELDQLIAFFFANVHNPRAQAEVQRVMIEADRLADCILKVDGWIEQLRSSPDARMLAETWKRDREQQIIELNKGCNELIDVFNNIIPRQVAHLLKPHLD